MKNVAWMSWRRSRSRIRGTATAPNSPRESAATLPSAISNTHGERASKSNVRQTDSFAVGVTSPALPPAAVHDVVERSPVGPAQNCERAVGRDAQRDEMSAKAILREAEEA